VALAEAVAGARSKPVARVVSLPRSVGRR
jgi:hypothetical protein